MILNLGQRNTVAREFMSEISDLREPIGQPALLLKADLDVVVARVDDAIEDQLIVLTRALSDDQALRLIRLVVTKRLGE